MKICVISTSVFAVGQTGAIGYSGLEHLAWQQAKGLAAKGHEVSLVAAEGSFCPGVQIIPGGPPGQWDERKSYSTYWNRLLEFDAVIDNSWNKWSYILKAEGVLKVPVLGVCHAPVNTMYQQLPAVDKPCFVCISKDQAAHFEALHSRPARVCYNGVDLDYYKPLDIPRSNRFLFLARFSSIKGPDLAIKACLEAGVGLDLVGDTSITNEPDYFKECQKMADGKQIRIVGPASRAECVWWFSQAHALLHPNKRFREPFGLAPVESMACGTPVIGWNYGAMRETVNQGRTGVIVNSEEELMYTIKSFKDRELDIQSKSVSWWHNPDMRSECREHVKQFSIEKMVDRYEELINEAIQTGGW